MMKALSIRQPFATLILEELKDIEHRSYSTNYRGDFIIHSSKNPFTEFMKEYGFNNINFPNGYLLGIVELYDVKQIAEKSFAWYLRFMRKFKKPIPYKGKLNFFEVKDFILKQTQILFS
ncbi:MAG: ASCH domain-containing protein [Candidatus Thorarchaeota archaeon]